MIFIEAVLDKIDEIKAALYDLPWYTMDEKDRKMLLIMMQCNLIQPGFMVLHIHPMTIERFCIVIQAGYTNLLILKDLIQK